MPCCLTNVCLKICDSQGHSLQRCSSTHPTDAPCTALLLPGPAATWRQRISGTAAHRHHQHPGNLHNALHLATHSTRLSAHRTLSRSGLSSRCHGDAGATVVDAATLPDHSGALWIGCVGEGPRAGCCCCNRQQQEGAVIRQCGAAGIRAVDAGGWAPLFGLLYRLPPARCEGTTCYTVPVRIPSLSRKPCTSKCVLMLPGCCLCALQISKTASQRMCIDTVALAAMVAAAVGVHVLLLTVNTLACRYKRQTADKCVCAVYTASRHPSHPSK